MSTTRLHQLTANPLVPDVRQALRDPYDMHRSLLRAFEEALPDASSSTAQHGVALTWRVEQHDDAGARLLITESAAVAPDWSALSAGYLLAAPATKDITDHLDALRAGTCVRFRILTEPTRATPAGPGVRGKRKALQDPAERGDWLMRQFARGGLTLTNVVEHPHPRISAKAGAVCLSPTLFDGTASVVDADAARALVRHGLGRGKAFGLGMLSVLVC